MCLKCLYAVLHKLSVTKENGVSNVQVHLVLAKMSSYRIQLILEPGNGHLAALWIIGLASVLWGGDSALLRVRTWFCNLALIVCKGKVRAAL